MNISAIRGSYYEIHILIADFGVFKQVLPISVFIGPIECCLSFLPQNLPFSIPDVCRSWIQFDSFISSLD
jgi:hypothetical protein